MSLGSPRVDLEEAASTQIEARRLADQGAPHGALVVARRQSAGRGRQGRVWHTVDDALAFSVVLRPEVEPRSAARVTLVAGVALVEALLALGVDAGVKWPNDVLVKARAPGPLGPYRKVAGILVEIVFLGQKLDAAILGVGVNVRAPEAGFPDEVKDVAGALSDAGYEGSREEVLQAMLAHLERRLPALGDDAGFQDVLDVHRRRSATLGRRIEVRDGEQLLSGEAVDLDEEGCLVVADRCGHLRTVRAGDVWPAS